MNVGDVEFGRGSRGECRSCKSVSVDSTSTASALHMSRVSEPEVAIHPPLPNLQKRHGGTAIHLGNLVDGRAESAFVIFGDVELAFLFGVGEERVQVFQEVAVAGGGGAGGEEEEAGFVAVASVADVVIVVVGGCYC